LAVRLKLVCLICGLTSPGDVQVIKTSAMVDIRVSRMRDTLILICSGSHSREYPPKTLVIIGVLIGLPSARSYSVTQRLFLWAEVFVRNAGGRIPLLALSRDL